MTADQRPRLLARIHEDLDDDLARSVYADYLLEHETSDAWHAELIQLQLAGRNPERVTEILKQHETRALGPLARLYWVEWTRGFPDHVRADGWEAEHVRWLLESPYLPTIRSIEVRIWAESLPSVLDVPEVASRLTTLSVINLTPALLARLLADSTPRLRQLRLRLRPSPVAPGPQALWPASLPALLASPLAAHLDVIQIGIPVGAQWSASFPVPRTLQQLDLLEVDARTDITKVRSFVRDPDGRLVESDDPLHGQVCAVRYDGLRHDFDQRSQRWSLEHLQAFADRLARAKLVQEAAKVREIVADRVWQLENPDELEDDED